MAVSEQVIIELIARTDALERELRRSGRNADRELNGIEARASRFASRLSSLFAGVSAAALAQQFLKIADESKKLDAQLKLATAGFGSFAQAQEDVRKIADQTRSGLSDTASLYANFVRGAKELGGSQADAARATETFSKTLKISGADTNQAASATLQFGQALAAGALRGDELNSILEASPRLARLLAESMGQPIGQIKQLGEEGKLTSDKLLTALTDRKFTSGIDAEFRQMPVTFDEAMTKVYNAAVISFGAFDRGGEFSTALANFVSDGADGFADLEKSAEQFGITVRSTLAGLGDAFDPLLQSGLSVFEQLGGGAFDLQQFIRTTLKEADALLNIGPSVANWFGANGKYDSRLLERYDATQKRERDRLSGQAAQRRFDAQMSRYDVFGNLIAGNPGAAPGARPKPAASTKKTKTPKSPLDPDAFAREEAQLNDRILSLKADEVVGIAAKAKIETDRIEASRAAAIKEIEGDKKYTSEQKEKLTALTGTVAALQSAKVIAERDKDLAAQVAEARAGNLRYEREALEATAQAADTRQERLAAERRILEALDAQERAELEAAIAAGKIADAAKARADLATAQTTRRGATERDLRSPLARYSDRFNPDNRHDQVEELIVQELDYVRDGISDAITSRLGVKDPLISGLLDMLIQQVIMKPIAEALSSASSQGGGVGAFLSAASTAIFGRASGGPVAAGQIVRVNENATAGRVEAFRPTGSGEIIPLGRMNAPSRAAAQTVVVQVQANDYFDAKVAGIGRAVATPIARRESTSAATASYAQSQQSAPGTINKYSQLKG
jgi:tape measure domain-containing protein